MKELERVRYRYSNFLSPVPVLAVSLELAEHESVALDSNSVAAIEAAFPLAARARMRVHGEAQPVSQALRSDVGCYVAFALTAFLLQQDSGVRSLVCGARLVGKQTAIAYFGYSDWCLAEAVADDARMLVAALLGTQGPAAFRAGVARAKVRVMHRQLDQTTRAMVAGADKLGIPWHRIGPDDNIVQLGWGARQCMLRETLVQSAPATGLLMARDKPTTISRLAQFGLPVPRYKRVGSPAHAVAVARELGGRVVVKPTGGTKAMGVTTDLSEPADIERAFEAARRYGVGVMVEQHLEGADHRLLVVGGKLVAAAKRIPGGVTGDGRQTVSALLEQTNRDPRRGRGYEKLLNIIEVDAEAQQLLRSQDLTLESVPAAGQWVPLRRVGNISQGGLAVDVTDQVHLANVIAVEEAAKALDLPVAGVDFLSPDISRAWSEVGGGICEVNSTPGLRPHWVADPQRDVVTPVLRLAFAENDQGRIPIAAVTGTHGKTTVARMLSAIWRQEGPGVGLSTTDGIRLDDDWVAIGDGGGSNAGDMLLANQRVRCAVMETARGGILRRGFAFDRCDVAAVTCVGEDHLGFEGVKTIEDMAHVKGRLVGLAGQAVVLNLADPLVRAMAPRRRRGVRLIWVLPPGAALDAVGEFEAAERVEIASHEGEAWILLRDGERRVPLAAVSKIPATEGGTLGFNLINACFAAAMALGLGHPVERIAAGLAAFQLDSGHSLGRFHRIEAAERTVVLDFAHNPLQVQQMSALLAKRYADRRRLCAFTAPGHRLEPVYDQVASAVAGHFQGYVAYERVDWRRDKPTGWISHRLAAGLAGTATPDGVVEALTQEEGIKALFKQSRPGDLLAVLGADSHAAAAQIEAVLRRLSRKSGAGSATPAEPQLADH